MLLREHSDEQPGAVIVIGQASHAWISGQLAREWGNRQFAAPEPREEVCLAAEQHDVGMAEWDLRPSLNARTGLPHSFLEMPLATHVALWTAAPAKLMSQSHHAALLVSMHGTALYERRDLERLEPDERRLARNYLAGQRELQARLASRLGLGDALLRRNQRLLWTWDALSLALCLRWKSLRLAAVPAAGGTDQLDIALQPTTDHRVTLEPWPFGAARVEVRCEGRKLDGRFETEAALHAALARAPLVELEFVLEAPAAVSKPR